MPTNLTGNPVSFPTQTAPVGGDPRTASSVSTPLQNAADRTQYLKAQLEANALVYRTVLSVADLRALTVHANNQLVFVASFGETWIYNGAGTASDDGLTVAKPDDVVGNGRWFNINLLYAAGAANHAPGPLSAGGKIPAAQIINGAKEVAFAGSTSSVTTSSNTFSEPSGVACSLLTVTSGDVIQVEYMIEVAPASGSGAVVKPVYSRDASAFDVLNGVFLAEPAIGRAVDSGAYFITADFTGQWDFSLNWRATNGATNTAHRRFVRATLRSS